MSCSANFFVLELRYCFVLRIALSTSHWDVFMLVYQTRARESVCRVVQTPRGR